MVPSVLDLGDLISEPHLYIESSDDLKAIGGLDALLRRRLESEVSPWLGRYLIYDFHEVASVSFGVKLNSALTMCA